MQRAASKCWIMPFTYDRCYRSGQQRMDEINCEVGHSVWLTFIARIIVLWPVCRAVMHHCCRIIQYSIEFRWSPSPAALRRSVNPSGRTKSERTKKSLWLDFSHNPFNHNTLSTNKCDAAILKIPCAFCESVVRTHVSDMPGFVSRAEQPFFLGRRKFRSVFRTKNLHYPGWLFRSAKPRKLL